MRVVKGKAAAILNACKWLWYTRRLIVSPLRTLRFSDLTDEPDYKATFRYPGGRFVCRKQDWFGVKEVFLDDEYLPALSCLAYTPSPVVVDLGANIGAFALYVFSYYRNARLLSVEAAPDTFEILSDNRRLNTTREWRVVNAAVWSENGSINLDRREASTGHRVRINRGAGETVPARRLADIVAEARLGDIDLLKMDIEGAEETVIPQAEDVLQRTKVLVIEVHTDRMDPTSVYEVLARSFGYCWELKGRSVEKPVLILSREKLSIDGAMAVDPLRLHSA